MEAAIKSQLRPTAVEVVPLKYSHLLRLLDTVDAAQAHDPLYRYVTAGRTDALFRHFQRLQRCIRFANLVRKHGIFTVGAGDAMVTYGPPGNWPPEDGLGKVLDALAGFTRRLLRRLASKEVQKRSKELMDKAEAAVKDAFGGAADDMIELGSICTHPAKQRLGYGTALVQFITDRADARARSTFLLSSNVDNTGFYEGCGFKTVAEFTLGDSNPTWKEPPVVVRVMLRKLHLDEKRPL